MKPASTPIKYVARINQRVIPEDTDPSFRFHYIDISQVNALGEVTLPSATTTFTDAPSRARRLAPAGATVVSTVRTYLRAIARVPSTDRPLIFSTGFAVLEPTAIDSRFLSYACRAASFIEEVVSRSTGVSYPAINPSEIGNISLFTPPHSEQRRIADFLDERVTRIDQIIAARREQHQKIAEHANATLNNLVIEGDSLGWRRLQDFADPQRPIQYGIVLPGPSVEEGIPIIKGGDIGSGRLSRLELNKTTPEIEAPYRRSRVHPGDYVISIRGSVGEIAAVPAALSLANLTQDSARIAPYDCDPGWLIAVLNSPMVQSEMQSLMTGSTVRGLNIETLRRIPIPLAHPERQTFISGEFRKLRLATNHHTAGLHQSITLLAEYKQSLITAAVTGEFDVTTASTKIPGE